MNPVVIFFTAIGVMFLLCMAVMAILAYYDEKEVMKGRQSQWDK